MVVITGLIQWMPFPSQSHSELQMVRRYLEIEGGRGRPFDHHGDVIFGDEHGGFWGVWRAGGEKPCLEGEIEGRRDDEGRVSADCQAGDHVTVAVQTADHFPCGHIPHEDLHVGSRRDDEQLVGGVPYRRDLIVMAFKPLHKGTISGVPQLDELIPAGGSYTTLRGREVDIVDGTGMNHLQTVDVELEEETPGSVDVHGSGFAVDFTVIRNQIGEVRRRGLFLFFDG